MNLTTHCTGCQHPFTVPARFAGKTVRCKHCGTSFAIPRPAAAKRTAAAPAADRRPVAQARAAVAAPAGIPPRDDPFDVLADLERTGQPAAEPLPMFRPPPAASLPSAHNQLDYGRAPRRSLVGYVSFPHDDKFDLFVPPAALVAYAIFLIWQFTKITALGAVLGASAGAASIILIVLNAGVFGILVPMSILGPMTAGRILNFELPSKSYLRMAAVVAIAALVNGILNDGRIPTKDAVTRFDAVLLPLGIWLAAFWLMFRLQPAQFVLSVVFGFIFLVIGLVVTAVVMVILAGLIGVVAKIGVGLDSGTASGAGYVLDVDVDFSIPDAGARRASIKKALVQRLNDLEMDKWPGQPFKVEAKLEVTGSTQVTGRPFSYRDRDKSKTTLTVHKLSWQLNVFDASGNAVSRDKGDAPPNVVFPPDADGYNKALAIEAAAWLVLGKLPTPPPELRRSGPAGQPSSAPPTLSDDGYTRIEARLPATPPRDVDGVADRAVAEAGWALKSAKVHGSAAQRLRVVVSIKKAGRETVALPKGNAQGSFDAVVDTLRVQIDVYDRSTNRLLHRGSAVVDNGRNQVSFWVHPDPRDRAVTEAAYHAKLWEEALRRIRSLKLQPQP